MFLLPTVLSTLTAVSAMPKEVDLVPTETFMTENVKTVYAGDDGDKNKKQVEGKANTNTNTKEEEQQQEEKEIKENTEPKPVEQQDKVENKEEPKQETKPEATKEEKKEEKNKEDQNKEEENKEQQLKDLQDELDEKAKELDREKELTATIKDSYKSIEERFNQLTKESHKMAIDADNAEINNKLNEQSKIATDWTNKLRDDDKKSIKIESSKLLSSLRPWDPLTANTQYKFAKLKLKCLELCKKDCKKGKNVESMKNAIDCMEKNGMTRQAGNMKSSLNSIIENCEKERDQLKAALGCKCNGETTEEAQQKAEAYWYNYAKNHDYSLDDIPDFLNTGNDDEEINSVTDSFSLLKAETKPANNKFNMVRNAKKFFITNLVGMNFLRKM